MPLVLTLLPTHYVDLPSNVNNSGRGCLSSCRTQPQEHLVDENLQTSIFALFLRDFKPIVARVVSLNLKEILLEQPPPPPPYTHSNPPTSASFPIPSDEKATHSEISHRDEERIAAWVKAEKERVQGWESSERHKINCTRQRYGDAEAEKALERMRIEVANAYERIEKERDAALERAKKQSF